MTDISANNKRIAKNTGYLYMRMLLLMFISLYTSRIVLKVLGVEDFGIYNVVGGVVAMLSFLNSSLSTATQRYLNYEMGKGNREALQDVFSMSFIAYCILSIIAVILAETVGLWFVCNKLVIPAERFDAAIWIYHFSVLTFVVNLLTVSYNATIIAHERMSIYAYISIGDAVLRLVLIFLLQIINVDKLWLYGLLMLLVSCMVCFAYRIVCVRSFQECRVRWIWDKNLLKGLFSFSGWMLSGTITNLLSTQGVNILINMFFGPTLNAARAVAMQVNAAVNSFVANFMTATRPQIIKSYAEGNTTYMYRLVFTSSKASFFLLFILAIPILFNTEYILGLWLKTVPEYAVFFTQLVLIDLLIQATYSPIAYVSQASGKIRNYQLVISVGFVLIAVLTWIAYKLGYPVYTTFYIAVVIDFIGLFMRLAVLYKTVSFPVAAYFRVVIYPVSLILIFSLSASYIPKLFLGNIANFLSVGLYALWCVGVTGLFIWLGGLDKGEKGLLLQGVQKIFKR